MSRLEITLDSREVATLMEKEPKELLRDIRRYVEQIEEVNKKAFEEGKGNERKIALVRNIYKIKSTTLGEITSFVREMDKVMRDQNSYPSEIAEAFKEVCGQFGIKLPENFVREPQVIEVGGFLPYEALCD